VTLRALLFDVDGTLADTERFGHRPAYNRAFHDLGLGFRWNPQLYRKLLAQQGGRERLRHFLEHYRPDLGAHRAAADADFERWIDEVHDLKTQYFQDYLRDGRVPLRPGVARLIRQAQAEEIRVALVTNASRGSLQPMLRYGLGPELAGSVDVIVCGEDVARKKPHPEPYQLALQRLGLRASDCVALEDSWMGLTAAAAAGVATVITVNANTADDDFDAASLVLEHCGEPDLPSRVLRGRLSGDYLTLNDLRQVRACWRAAA
jgi:HAD superfamily hydrolase (TIGR01509 family)